MQRLLLILLLLASCQRERMEPLRINTAPPEAAHLSKRYGVENHIIAAAQFSISVVNSMPDPEGLSQAISDNALDAKEAELMPYWLGFSCAEEMQTEMQAFRVHLDAIKSVSPEDITKVLKEWFDGRRIMVGPCEAARRNCLGGVIGTAMGMHGSCMGLAPTGIGSVLCHAGAFIFHYFAGNECNQQYTLCLRSQP